MLSDPKKSAEQVGILLRGAMMGVAELVPGVSGGTIAFISGIYPRLLDALSSFGPQSLTMLLTPKRFWRHHHLNFVLVLVAGMGLGIISCSRIIAYLLSYFEPALWAFFFGVIAASVGVIGRQRPWLKLCQFGLPGLVLGSAFLLMPVQDFAGSAWLIFAAGILAISAWMLPGVSGSFVLLMLGLYEAMVAAVNAFDLSFLLTLGAGCLAGLMLLTRGLKWLLVHYTDSMLSLLVGFMAGTMIKLWPWQLANGANIYTMVTTPDAYAAAMASDALLLPALFAATLGALLVGIMSRFAAS